MKKSIKVTLFVLAIICIAVVCFVFVRSSNNYPSGNIKLPGGGFVVPAGNNPLSISYDQCVKTTDDQLKDICARKYSVEKKDPTLCRSLWAGLIGQKSPYNNAVTVSAADVVLQQNICLYSYAITYHDANICQSMDTSSDKDITLYKNMCFTNVSKSASSTL